MEKSPLHNRKYGRPARPFENKSAFLQRHASMSPRNLVNQENSKNTFSAHIFADSLTHFPENAYLVRRNSLGVLEAEMEMKKITRINPRKIKDLVMYCPHGRMPNLPVELRLTTFFADFKPFKKSFNLGKSVFAQYKAEEIMKNKDNIMYKAL